MTILSKITLAVAITAVLTLAGAAQAGGGGLCDGKTQAETNLDFYKSTVKENTLHKEGGRIVYENIGVVRDKPVNLVVTVVEGTKYSTTKPNKNGKSGGSFGNINLQTFRSPKDEDGLYDGTGNFQFCFRDKDTDDLVEVDSFQWSVYDLDERNEAWNGIKEKMIIDVSQASDYMLYPDIQGSEVKLSCEDGSTTLPCGPGVRTVFHSSTKGYGSDNPKDKDNMTEQQLKRSVIFRFDNKSCWTFTYSHYCPPDEDDPENSPGCSWYGGGNFLYAGEAKQLIEEGECITKSPTAAPSLVPTTLPPTVKPTQSPTAKPTESPTAKPTESPTAKPTESPTAKPTEFPTTKPTESPTTKPTESPTVKRTDPPTGSPTASPTDVEDVVQFPTASPTKATDPPIVTNGEDDDDDFIFVPSCPEDVTVVKQVGVTGFPDDPNEAVKIVSQDLSTVTVKLNQAWSSPGDEDIPIDHIYYSFMEDTFDEKCYEESQVADGTFYDTITIQCDVTKPIALLEICLADNIENELLTVEDNAVVPKCCHPSFPPDTPVVCYTVEINCVTECIGEEVKERRGLLRGSR